jgi:hypothetical protein
MFCSLLKNKFAFYMEVPDHASPSVETKQSDTPAAFSDAIFMPDFILKGAEYTSPERRWR